VRVAFHPLRGFARFRATLDRRVRLVSVFYRLGSAVFHRVALVK
jgi:hypothetical protein